MPTKYRQTLIARKDSFGEVDPDELDWKIMETVRALARASEVFDPAFYAATAGKLAHGHACELPKGHFMVIDLNNETSNGGEGNRFSDYHCSLVPNHRFVMLERVGDGLLITFARGENLVLARKGTIFPFSDRDPQYS